MPNIATLDRFIFNSDFPADMITFYMAQDFTINAGTTGTKTFAHNQLYTPLCFGVWATKEDFSDSRPISDGWFGLQVKSNSTNVIITYDFSTQTSNTHVYLRIYGYTPCTYTGVSQPTSRRSSPLIFDTRLDYAPLLFEGAFTTKAISSYDEQVNLEYNIKNGYMKQVGEGNSLTLYHDLAYMPNIMVWAEQNGEIRQASGAVFDYYAGWYSQSYPEVNYGSNSVFVNLGAGWSGDPIITTHVRLYA